jgi:hypothetical protein
VTASIKQIALGHWIETDREKGKDRPPFSPCLSLINRGVALDTGLATGPRRNRKNVMAITAIGREPI